MFGQPVKNATKIAESPHQVALGHLFATPLDIPPIICYNETNQNQPPERTPEMAKQTWKGSALLAPVPPVMVTCGDMENSNIITVAWAGLINTHPPRVSISVRPTRHSYNLIKESGEFIINLTPASLIRECDYCGIYTGAKVDKFAKTGLHKAPASEVKCPVIEE